MENKFEKRWENGNQKYVMRWFRPYCFLDNNMEFINNIINDIDINGIEHSIATYIPKKFKLNWDEHGIIDYDTPNKESIFSINRIIKKEKF